MDKLNYKPTSTNHCSLEKEIPFQSKLNSNLSNLCMDYQYDKRKLVIYYQNIQGPHNKTNKILRHLYYEFSNFLCLTEHHSPELEIENENWKLHPWGSLL
jgi:hypothetical protein